MREGSRLGPVAVAFVACLLISCCWLVVWCAHMYTSELGSSGFLLRHAEVPFQFTLPPEQDFSAALESRAQLAGVPRPYWAFTEWTFRHAVETRSGNDGCHVHRVYLYADVCTRYPRLIGERSASQDAVLDCLLIHERKHAELVAAAGRDLYERLLRLEPEAACSLLHQAAGHLVDKAMYSLQQDSDRLDAADSGVSCMDLLPLTGESTVQPEHHSSEHDR